ncbi:hypothetical protein BTA51_09280 [Hahella sp. CCB-MM4]|uniref:response regulator transcription factor n=1 Tax=Hahella sp. (strain CCB-MM4) TaxID=1926491 RepID=UPI000B9A7C44|nr:winged helix-turn-helix domain-containing protein [Hahella sp. CCB-MM4]OZG73961.1 hypothetical protein BTA51_09280 [Hahella sp. CCB-MM4]
MYVAIIDDNNALCEQMDVLKNQGRYNVVHLPTIDDYYNYYISRPKIDILIIYLAIHNTTGVELIRQLHQTKGIGILLYTNSNNPDERIQGLYAGADACLTLDSSTSELIAVIESLLRRIHTEPDTSDTNDNSTWFLCPSKRTLRAETGTEIKLTATEGIILDALAKIAPLPASRKTLIESLNQDFRHYDERRLEASVSRLRKKLNVAMAGTESIKAARGLGYQLLLNLAT